MKLNIYISIFEDRKGRDFPLALTTFFTFWYSKGHIRHMSKLFLNFNTG